MLFDLTSEKVRLTRSELAELRTRAARKGYAINQIQNNDEAVDVLLKALPRGIADNLLQFLKTGRSPLTESGSLELFKELIGGLVPACRSARKHERCADVPRVTIMRRSGQRTFA